jgi:hypothetical protein
MFRYNKKIDKKCFTQGGLVFNIDDYNESKEIIEPFLTHINKIWNKDKEKRALKLLSEDFDIPEKIYNIKYYVISRPRSGYDRKKNHIYISLRTRDLRMTIIHELHHIIFLNNFYKILKNQFKLSDKQIGEFKEVMVFMINSDKYRSITLAKDKTYKDIVKFQEKLSIIWEKSRGNFDSFLPIAVDMYRKKYVK